MDHSQSRPAYSFRDFTLDIDRGALLRNTKEVRLRPQSFEVLRILIERHGRLVTKAELQKAIWGRKAVTDDSLTQCLIDIRRALGDDSLTMVRTVPRRGYIFEVPVEESDRARTGGREIRRPGLVTVAIVATGIVVAALATYAVRLDSPAAPASIAVLPFENWARADGDEAFVEGIYDQIVAELGRIEELRVISRMSAERFRKEPVGLPEVGRALDADYIMTGSVLRAQETLRLNLRMYHAYTDEQVWAETYDRRLSIDNILNVQREVAGTVAAELDATIRPEDNEPRQPSGPANLTALDRYHNGMHYLRRIETDPSSSDEVFEAAIERFEAAIEADPHWAPAHAALGRVYHFWAHGDDDKFRKSKAHIQEALRLDDELAIAYESLGYIRHRWERDHDGALQAYERARSLDGRIVWAYAILLREMGRFEEAIEKYRVALAADPLSLQIKTQLGFTYACAGRYREAIAQLEEVRAAHPRRESAELHTVLFPLAYSYLKIGDVEKGVALAEELEAAYGEVGGVALVFALAGMRARAESAMALQESLGLWDVYSTGDVIAAAIALGDEERALGYMEMLAAEQLYQLRFVRCSEEVRSLTGNPRYERVLAQLGVPN